MCVCVRASSTQPASHLAIHPAGQSVSQSSLPCYLTGQRSLPLFLSLPSIRPSVRPSVRCSSLSLLHSFKFTDFVLPSDRVCHLSCSGLVLSSKLWVYIVCYATLTVYVYVCVCVCVCVLITYINPKIPNYGLFF